MIEKHFKVGEYLEAGDTRQLLKLLAGPPPELAILDLDESRENEMDLISLTRQSAPDFPILGTSEYSDLDRIEAAVTAGVKGFVCKAQSHESFIHAVQLLLQGDRYLSREYLAKTKADLLPPLSYSPHHPLHFLSSREAQVFQLIGIKMTCSQIAEYLGLSPKTIETYRENLKLKLGLTSGTELTRTAMDWVEQGHLQ